MMNEAELLERFGTTVAADLRLLARLHDRELEPEAMRELRRVAFPHSLGLRVEGVSGTEALALLARAVDSWPDPAPAELVDELAADYAAIYLNHAYQASPYESVWLDEDHLAMQEPMFQIRDWYRRHRLGVADWRKRSEDHLTHQLIFLAHLLESRERDRFQQLARFLDEHLLRWIGRFSDHVAQRAQEPFYAGLALLTAAYLDELRDLIAQILGEPRPDPQEIEHKMRQVTRQGQRPDLSQPAAYVPGVGPTW